MELVVLFIIIIIIGALLGAKSFGGTIRTGCGCIVMSLILIAAVIFFGTTLDQEEDGYKNFIVNQYSEIYSEPDINSDVIGYAEKGEEVYVEDIDRFNYFYEIESDYGTIYYILKDNLSSNE